MTDRQPYIDALAAALATLPSHIEWQPSCFFDATRFNAEVFAVLTAEAIHIRLTVSFGIYGSYGLTANITGHDRPHVCVSSWGGDLLSAWTEVAEVVARVDAAAGAAVGQPCETKADAPKAGDVQAALDDHCKRLKAKPGRKCDDCGYTIDDCECGGLRPQTSYG